MTTRATTHRTDTVRIVQPLRWASWVAVSSAPQAAEDKISIPHQRQLNQEHCARHGGEIIAELLVPGESRHIPTWEEACTEVTAYALLRDLIVRKQIDVLVFYDRTRLGRMASLIMTIEALCLRAGIALYETTNPPAEIKAGYQYERSLIGAIGAVGAQQEIEKLKERRRIGMINRVQRGEFAGRPNWGYRYHFAADGTRSVEVDEDAAHVVGKIFALYLEGNGTVAIAGELNGHGYRTPNGRPWIKSTVRAILTSGAIYAGYAEANRKSQRGAPLARGRGAWQPLITEEQWQQVEAEMSDRKSNRHLPQTPYRLSSVCFCSVCGALMSYQRNRNYRGQHFVYLVCSRHPPRHCVREDLILATVEATIVAASEGRIEAASADNETIAGLQAALDENKKRLDALQNAFALADNAYITQRMDIDRYDAQVVLLRGQQTALEQDRVRLLGRLRQETGRTPRAAKMLDIAQNGLSMLYDPDTAKSNRWLRQIFRVWCDGKDSIVVDVVY